MTSFSKSSTQISLGNVPQAQIDGQAQLAGFLVHTFKTTDKVVKYGENNRVDFLERPTAVLRGNDRIINVYVDVPNFA